MGGGGSNLSVHWTLTVRNSYFDSPLKILGRLEYLLMLHNSLFSKLFCVEYREEDDMNTRKGMFC